MIQIDFLNTWELKDINQDQSNMSWEIENKKTKQNHEIEGAYKIALC